MIYVGEGECRVTSTSKKSLKKKSHHPVPTRLQGDPLPAQQFQHRHACEDVKGTYLNQVLQRKVARDFRQLLFFMDGPSNGLLSQTLFFQIRFRVCAVIQFFFQ
jgi:hypothetical protein